MRDDEWFPVTNVLSKWLSIPVPCVVLSSLPPFLPLSLPLSLFMSDYEVQGGRVGTCSILPCTHVPSQMSKAVHGDHHSQFFLPSSPRDDEM